ncbi:MAG: FAD-dependent oxidoreductase, partial [Bacteroidales bacterium]
MDGYGVAGGASAAARLRRNDEHSKIILVEKGAYISYANCGLPYYIGNVIKSRDMLFVQNAADFGKRFNIDVRLNCEAISINTHSKLVELKDLNTNTVVSESYTKLVLSPGAFPVKPPLPGINNSGIFTLRNVSDTDAIKQYIDIYKISQAVVVGAGFIGLEMAENLHNLGIKVSIVEMAPQVMPGIDFSMASLVHSHIKSKNVNLYLNDAVSSFEKQGNNIITQLRSGRTIQSGLVILSIGVKPDTTLAKNAGLKIGDAGGIWVNEFMQTSHPDVYAVGDAIEFPHPLTGKSCITYLAGPANKQGRIAADNITTGNTIKYKGAIGTSIAKVFDITVASTGLSAKTLQKENIPYISSITHSGSHAGYYPGALQMTIKICFSKKNGQVLGAQIVGYDGVDKRCDLLAGVIQNKGTVQDLLEIEHAY